MSFVTVKVKPLRIYLRKENAEVLSQPHLSTLREHLPAARDRLAQQAGFHWESLFPYQASHHLLVQTLRAAHTEEDISWMGVGVLRLQRYYFPMRAPQSGPWQEAALRGSCLCQQMLAQDIAAFVSGTSSKLSLKVPRLLDTP